MVPNKILVPGLRNFNRMLFLGHTHIRSGRIGLKTVAPSPQVRKLFNHSMAFDHTNSLQARFAPSAANTLQYIRQPSSTSSQAGQLLRKRVYFASPGCTHYIFALLTWWLALTRKFSRLSSPGAFIHALYTPRKEKAKWLPQEHSSQPFEPHYATPGKHRLFPATALSCTFTASPAHRACALSDFESDDQNTWVTLGSSFLLIIPFSLLSKISPDACASPSAYKLHRSARHKFDSSLCRKAITSHSSFRHLEAYWFKPNSRSMICRRLQSDAGSFNSFCW